MAKSSSSLSSTRPALHCSCADLRMLSNAVPVTSYTWVTDWPGVTHEHHRVPLFDGFGGRAAGVAETSGSGSGSLLSFDSMEYDSSSDAAVSSTSGRESCRPTARAPLATPVDGLDAALGAFRGGNPPTRPLRGASGPVCEEASCARARSSDSSNRCAARVASSSAASTLTLSSPGSCS